MARPSLRVALCVSLLLLVFATVTETLVDEALDNLWVAFHVEVDPTRSVSYQSGERINMTYVRVNVGWDFDNTTSMLRVRYTGLYVLSAHVFCNPENTTYAKENPLNFRIVADGNEISGINYAVDTYTGMDVMGAATQMLNLTKYQRVWLETKYAAVIQPFLTSLVGFLVHNREFEQ